MPVVGLRDSSDFLTTQRPQDWREGLMLLYPNSALPLTALTSLMKKESTVDPQFNWHEKPFNPLRLQLGANLGVVANGTAENITVVASSFGGALQVKKDTLLYAEETGEVMRVTADPANQTTIAVIRGIMALPYAGNTTIVDFDGDAVNPFLTVIGTAFMEGQDIPTAIGQNPAARFNYTQIFRDSLAITRTAQNTKLRTPDQVKESKREALEQHGIGMERAFLWGVPFEDLTGTQPRRGTQGIINLLRTSYAGVSEASMDGNVWDAGGAGVDLETLENLLERIFFYGSDEKMCFCGNSFVLAINRIVRKNTDSPYMISQGQKEYGMNIQRLTSPFGELVLKRHPLFNQMPGGSNPTTPTTPYVGWDSAGLVLDMKNVRYRYLKNSDTKYLPTRQGNGIDGMMSEYLTECGMEWDLPETHFLAMGLNTAAVDA